MARTSTGVRFLVLGGAGLAAFIAAAHLAGRAQDDGKTVAPTSRGERTAALPDTHAPSVHGDIAPASAASAASAPRADRGGAIPGDTGQPFVSTSWLPPPPPPPKPVVAVAAPPAAPVAPPLPFTFVGLVEKGTPKPQAFLARGDELLVVSQGDSLDNGAYRIDAVSPTQIVFIHVPTNTKQIISLSGGAS
ncbi:MAG TPA: hypothetical protein VES00_06805 [Burkholderiaceae bacterium]|jgi:hypothetical protein|nr:hypothetical protein [Burkholderiaceae bacterium]